MTRESENVSWMRPGWIERDGSEDQEAQFMLNWSRGGWERKKLRWGLVRSKESNSSLKPWSRYSRYLADGWYSTEWPPSLSCSLGLYSTTAIRHASHQSSFTAHWASRSTWLTLCRCGLQSWFHLSKHLSGFTSVEPRRGRLSVRNVQLPWGSTAYFG